MTTRSPTAARKAFIRKRFFEVGGAKRRDFDQLRGADELDYLVQIYNWDDGEEPMLWVLQSKHCDRGTALKVFWRSAPDHYYERFGGFEKTPKKERAEGWATGRLAEARLVSGAFEQSETPFDPFESMKGIAPSVLKKMPKAVLEPSQGTGKAAMRLGPRDVQALASFLKKGKPPPSPLAEKVRAAKDLEALFVRYRAEFLTPDEAARFKSVFAKPPRSVRALQQMASDARTSTLVSESLAALIAREAIWLAREPRAPISRKENLAALAKALVTLTAHRAPKFFGPRARERLAKAARKWNDEKALAALASLDG